MTALEVVAFDIETTGFDVTDEVTVVGFAVPLGCRVFVRGDAETDGETDVLVVAFNGEAEAYCAKSEFTVKSLTPTGYDQ